MSDIQQITERIRQFRDERDWKQFHNPKDSAIALTLEAAELLELFRFKGEAELADFVGENREAISEELVDVMYWTFLMASDLSIDLPTAFEKKMAKNEARYPVEKAKGRARKYTEL